MDPIVIVGGDAAGMSAASKIKREESETDVVVFEKGEWVSYGACGLPYYIKGDVETLDDLVSVSPAEFIQDRDIDLRMEHEVTAIDRTGQTVTVSGPDGEFDQPYGRLLITTGARAIEPPLDGIGLDGVFTLHDMNTAAEIRHALAPERPVGDLPELGYGGTAREYATTAEPDSVGIIGGGYVGIEMAEAFAEHGLDVHLFEMLPHTVQPFGADAAATVEEHLRQQGIDLHLDTEVDGIRGDKHVDAIDAGDETVPVDLALVGVGVAPNTELATTAGIETGPSGAIATDEYGQTSDDAVYAAGDCAEMTHTVTGEPTHVPLALTANRAGRAIGQTLSGEPTPVGDIAGTAAVKAFDLEVARTGIVDEERARNAGFDPVSVTINTRSRAHYYPGDKEIQVTLVGDRDSDLVLGASMVGREGVAKRIDTIAVALHADMIVTQLSALDLAYAPPFSPVWDPVLTAAKVLGSRLD